MVNNVTQNKNISDFLLIESNVIGDGTIQTVNARSVWVWLGSKQEFANWIKGRINKYGFVEGEDFCFDKFVKAGNNAVIKDYHISISMAKELCMIENNERGKEARRYFIEMEKKAKSLTQLQVLAQITQEMVKQEKLIAEHDDRIRRIEAKQTAFEEGVNYFSVVGYAAYKGFSVDLKTAQQLGKQASSLSKERGILVDQVKDPRFGYIGSYHQDVLAEVVNSFYNQ